MKEKNNGITVISFILIIIVTILAIFIINSSKIIKKASIKIDIAYKTITNKINIEEEIKENEKIMGITDVTGELYKCIYKSGGWYSYPTFYV